MLFEKKLIPDVMLEKFSDITPEMLKSLGIEALVCDIDNTLATYDDITMPETVSAWLDAAESAGIKVALVSNNSAARVARFAGGRDILTYPDAHKPSKTCFLDALSRFGVDASRAAVLGDQLLTDAWAARRVGMKALIVPPIKDRTGLFFRFKRALEKPYIRLYAKKHRDIRIGGTVWE